PDRTVSESPRRSFSHIQLSSNKGGQRGPAAWRSHHAAGVVRALQAAWRRQAPGARRTAAGHDNAFNGRGSGGQSPGFRSAVPDETDCDTGGSFPASTWREPAHGRMEFVPQRSCSAFLYAGDGNFLRLATVGLVRAGLGRSGNLLSTNVSGN